MKLSAPKQVLFIIAIIAAVVGIVCNFVASATVGFWIVTVAFVLLALGCTLKDL